jgi:anti-sigma regulatory factor (Ser/Thr protein kinase)
MAAALPRWWSRGFPGEPQQASQARTWVTRLLPACAPLDDLLLFTSELAANALTHTRSGEPAGWFTVEVIWTPQTARVVVGDHGSDEGPVNMADPSGQDAEGGRGLLLIDALAAAWGTVGDADARWVWADVDWRSQGGPLPATPSGKGSAEAQFADLCHMFPGASI